MKLKFVALIILSIAVFRLNSMESQLKLDQSPLWQQLPKELKAKVLRHAVWYALPQELKIHIVSYIAQSKSVADMIQSLKSVACVSKEFYSYVQILITEFAKNYIEQNAELAYKEFFDAIEKNKISVVRALINAGINVNVKLNIYDTPLTLAARNVHNEIVKMLLEANAEINVHDDWDRYTPLIRAAESNNKALVQMLIGAGADVNAQNIFHKTALYYAVKSGNKDTVEVLLNAGADCNIKIYEGDTVLFIAVLHQYKEIVKQLLNAGADPNNIRDNNSWTALADAVYTGDFELVQMLMNAGANVNAKFGSGNTALSIAIQRKQFHLLDLLKGKSSFEKATKKRKTDQ